MENTAARELGPAPESGTKPLVASWPEDSSWILSLCVFAAVPLWVFGNEGGGGVHARARREGVPSLSPPSLQEGKTRLHFAAEAGHVALVEQLLAAGDDMEAREDEVRGRNADRDVLRGTMQLFVSSCCGCFSCCPG